MADAGRPTDLTKEVIADFRAAILSGKNYKDFAESSGISYSTITSWTYSNYANIADKIEGWKRDRKINLATDNLEEFLMMDDADPSMSRIKADMTKFTLETLGKESYSKRSEHTGPDGKDLPTPILATSYVSTDNSNQESDGDEAKDTSSTGGDVSIKDDLNPTVLDTLSTERQEANTN